MSDKPWSKRAFQCYRCPKDGAADKSRGCPRWWKTVQTNVQTGETKVWEECGDVQWPVYATEIIKASNRPAAAVESCRNEVAVGLARVASVMADAVALAVPGMMLAGPRDKSLEIADGTPRLDNGSGK